MSYIELSIKYNNTHYKEPCDICGDITEAGVPLAIFKEKSKKGICDSCANKHSPELYKLLEIYYQAELQRFIREDSRDIMA